ncbi:MAG: 4Fe-4S binding protein [Nitrososphaeria archaeon]
MVRHKFVSYDPDKCVGCRVCEYVCSLEKDLPSAVSEIATTELRSSP